MQDVIVIGAGPVGPGVRHRSGPRGAAGRVIERAPRQLPSSATRLRWSSSRRPELIEIGGYPFPIKGYKPTREEAIDITGAYPPRRPSMSGSTSAC